MLNPMYVRLIQEQKVREMEAEIEMMRRCHEGYACQWTVIPWYTRVRKFFARPGASEAAPCACDAC